MAGQAIISILAARIDSQNAKIDSTNKIMWAFVVVFATAVVGLLTANFSSLTELLAERQAANPTSNPSSAARTSLDRRSACRAERNVRGRHPDQSTAIGRHHLAACSGGYVRVAPKLSVADQALGRAPCRSGSFRQWVQPSRNPKGQMQAVGECCDESETGEKARSIEHRLSGGYPFRAADFVLRVPDIFNV